jgi:hypothetical protein
MTRRVLALLNEPELHAAFSRESLRIVRERFSMERMVSSYQELLGSL